MAIEIGSLVVELSANVARLSQDMNKAVTTVDGAMGKVRSAAAAATTALGLIGVGVSVAGFAHIIRGAIDANAALDDMAEKTGATVENLSALSDVARIGGHDMGTIEAGMVRLTKALAGGDDEAKAAGHALEQLGLKAEDLRKMDTGSAMLEVAKALDQYADSGGKTALVIDLLGRNGAQMLPFLKDLTEKGELHAKVTAQEAAEAEKLQKQFNELKVAGDDLSRSLASITVPALLKVAENFKAAREAGYGFWQSLTGIGVRGINESVDDARNNAGGRIKELMAERDEISKGLGRGEDFYVKKQLDEVNKKLAYYRALQRDALAGQYAGGQYLDARDLAAQQKGDLTGYTSAAGGGKGKAPKASPYDPSLAGFDDNRSAKEIMSELHAQDKAAESLRAKYVAMIDPLQKYRDMLDEIETVSFKSQDEKLAAIDKVNEAMDEEFRRMTGVNDKLAEQKDIARELGMTFTSALEDIIVKGGEARDMIQAFGQDVARIIWRKQVTEPFAKSVSDWSSGLDFKSLFGFASGGSFTVGGSGGTDSQLVAFRATPGEEVSVRTPAQQSGGGITVVQNINIDARSDQATIMAAMVQAKNAAVHAIAESQRRGGAFA